MAQTKRPRGFAAMDREQQRRIASKGGKAAHASGHAHEWNSKEAAQAGHLGGIAAHQRGKRGPSNVKDATPKQADLPQEVNADTTDAANPTISQQDESSARDDRGWTTRDDTDAADYDAQKYPEANTDHEERSSQSRRGEPHYHPGD